MNDKIVLDGSVYLRVGPARRIWRLPFWGRALEWVRHAAMVAWRREVNETGDYRTIGFQGSQMEEARDAYAERAKALAEFKPVVAALESDLAHLLREFPGCDRSLRDGIAAVVADASAGRSPTRTPGAGS